MQKTLDSRFRGNGGQIAPRRRAKIRVPAPLVRIVTSQPAAPPSASGSSMGAPRPVSIRQEDLIQSVDGALQYFSYYHPVDYIRSLSAAYEREESPAAKDAIAQILINSRMCAEGHRPFCQVTGIVTVFLEIGMDVQWADATMGVEDMVNEGVRRAYNHPDNKLRASVLADPAGKRANTKDRSEERCVGKEGSGGRAGARRRT